MIRNKAYLMKDNNIQGFLIINWILLQIQVTDNYDWRVCGPPCVIINSPDSSRAQTHGNSKSGN